MGSIAAASKVFENDADSRFAGSAAVALRVAAGRTLGTSGAGVGVGRGLGANTSCVSVDSEAIGPDTGEDLIRASSSGLVVGLGTSGIAVSGRGPGKKLCDIPSLAHGDAVNTGQLAMDRECGACAGRDCGTCIMERWGFAVIAPYDVP